MRVKREVQVLSELGYRGATPVLEHMQIGLAFILAKHTYRKQVSYQLGFSNSDICPDFRRYVYALEKFGISSQPCSVLTVLKKRR